MEIIAENIGKKFSREWIFRNLSFTLSHQQSLAIIGSNGSGKSTLLQLIAGAVPASEGKVHYIKGKLKAEPENFFRFISFASPFLELIEEMTIREIIDFQREFKNLSGNMSTEEFVDRIQLKHAAEKEIRHLSSGMKQRVKLGLAMFSDAPVLMLDEPTTNLDTKGIDWYTQEIKSLLGKKLILISSNQKYEYDFCERRIEMGIQNLESRI